MMSVNILRVIYISFYSLTSRTRNNTVELIVKKNLLLWCFFCALEVTFYSLIYMGVGKGGGGAGQGHGLPWIFTSSLLNLPNFKILQFLAVNTCSILVSPPWKFFCRRPC